MSVGSGIIWWVGDYGGGDRKTRTMRLPFRVGVKPNGSGLYNLKVALSAYSDANDGDCEVLLKYTYNVGSPGVDANLDVKAQIAFKDPDDGKVLRIEIPAPKDSIFSIEGDGDRVDPTTLAAIVSALSTAFDRSFIPLWGKKIQRS